MIEALDLVLKKAGAQIGSLMLYDSHDQALRIVAAQGFDIETMKQIKNLKLTSGKGVAGHVYETGKPYYLKHPPKDPLFESENINLGPSFQFLSIPLKTTQSQTVGVLNIHFPAKQLLSASDLESLANLANRLTVDYLPRFKSPEPLPA